jgi:dethiobiotin synthetase
MIRIGVTGTDTGVGKTVIARALVAAFSARGLKVAAMKPVETGTAGGPPRDATQLAAATGAHDAPADVCPVTFAEPLAPLVAAERARRPVDLAVLDGAFGRLTAGRDAIVVEGAGGLLVPLTERVSYADLFVRWRLGMVVVAANRLGALNHVLLTVQAARAAGLAIRSVVMNSPVRETPDLAVQTNVEALRRLLPRVAILAWPWLADVDDDRVLASQAEQLGLVPLHPMEQTT